MANSSVVGLLRVLLTMDPAEFEAGSKRAVDTSKKLASALSSVGQNATQIGRTLTTALTVPLVGLAAGSIKAAMDFESSFAGVRKTVDATEKEFGALAQGLRDMAKEVPINVNELNKVAEAAGQLGIKKDDILQFTRTMADLSVTTNLTADEAATATAQFQNIFGAAGKDVDRFGATLVALGNNGASTEKGIMDMGLRIAGAGHQIGLTQGQVLAFASSLSSVGINAEAGGSAISRVFLKINDAVASGGSKLDEFARIAGMSSGQFKQAFQTDAAGATTAFISGLARIKGEGENVNGTLENLVGKNIIIKDTLLRASGAGTLLADSLKLQEQAWKDNTALANEAAERYKTFESQLTTLWNQIRDVGITLGTSLLPAMKDLVTVLTPVIAKAAEAAKWFSSLPEPLRLTAAGLLGVVAAAGPAIWALGQMATAGSAVVTAFRVGGFLAGVPGLMAGVGAAALAATPQVAAFAVAVASVASIGSFVRNAVGLYNDRIEQANLAIAQNVSHTRAMTDASAIAGRQITDLNEALGILRQHAAESAAEQAKLAAEHAKQAAAAGVSTTAAVTLSGQLAAMRAQVAALTAEQMREISAGDKLGLSTKELTKQLDAAHPSWKLTETVVEAATKRLDENAKAADKATKAQKAFRDSVSNAPAAMVPFQAAVKDAGESLQNIAAGLEEDGTLILRTREEMEDASKATAEWTRQNGLLAPSVKAVGSAAGDTEVKVGTMMARLSNTMGQINTAIQGTFAQMLLGGKSFSDGMSDVWSSLKAGAARAFTEILSDFAGRFMRGMVGMMRGQQGAMGQAFAGMLGGGGGSGMGSVAQAGFGLGGASTSSGAAGAGAGGAGAGAALAGGASAALAGFAMGKWGQEIFGGAGFKAGAFGAAGGALAGAAIGSVVPVLGTAVGAIIGGIAGMAAGFIGVSKQVKETRAGVDQFQTKIRQTLTDQQRAEAGGEAWKETVIGVRDAYMATGRTAEQAEDAVRRMWDTGHPDAAIAAVHEIDAAMQEYAVHLQEVARHEQGVKDAAVLFDRLMDKGSEHGLPAYMQASIDKMVELGLLTDEQAAKLKGLGTDNGVDIDKMEAGMNLFKGRREILGPQYEQAKVNQTAGQYIQAIDDMTRGGASLDQVLHDAQEEISALVVSALKSGSTIPENMKPWIEQLMAQGKLVDENGKKITDVSQLKFGDKVKTESEKAKDGWDAILLKIQELIDRITGPLTDAVTNLPSPNMPTPGGGGGSNGGGAGNDGGGGNTDNSAGFASGTLGRTGRWYKNFGRGTPTTLHGNEAVVTAGQAPAFAMDVVSGMLANAQAPSYESTEMPSGGGTLVCKVPFMVDGKKFAEGIVEYIPDALWRHGV